MKGRTQETEEVFMSFSGQVKNGVVVLDEGMPLPEGTRVQVEPLGPGPIAKSPLATALLQWAGRGVGLPEDLALNHDHYLHGQPKK